jgi:hypothetical protein
MPKNHTSDLCIVHEPGKTLSERAERCSYDRLPTSDHLVKNQALNTSPAESPAIQKLNPGYSQERSRGISIATWQSSYT